MLKSVNDVSIETLKVDYRKKLVDQKFGFIVLCWTLL